MTSALLFGLCGAALVGVGLYGLLARTGLERRALAFNVIGSGLFLLFGAIAARRPDLSADPVPQAMIITGIVVAFSATALFIALVERFAEESGRTTLPEESLDEDA